jgi:hypothetical protein
MRERLLRERQGVIYKRIMTGEREVGEKINMTGEVGEEKGT